ncbi:hypothetical protein SDC9_210449 [bioreactor metagenome]|uniref:Uncharacterized protein n=1 Tax=bioreactor metagenome TaxID=1076179 RepID=A0A645JGX7_9ZZZZ
MNFIDSDRFDLGGLDSSELSCQSLLFQLLDCMPPQMKIAADRSNAHVFAKLKNRPLQTPGHS